MPVKVAIMGGGPAGLVTLKQLLQVQEYYYDVDIEARLFEAEENIGGTFRYRVYEDAELVSSKYLTAFSDFRFRPEDANFVTPGRYCKYLEDYATKFDLWKHISCSAKITSVRRGKFGTGHIVTIRRTDTVPENGSRDEEWECDVVAICAGLHLDKNMPIERIRGLEKAITHGKVKVFHSSELKERQQFEENKNVVVLGAGETAMDVAHLAVTSPTKSVTLSHRAGFFYAPKTVPIPNVFGGLLKRGVLRGPKPIDTAVASLFDTAYVPPVIQQGRLLWTFYNAFVKYMAWLITGTTIGYDQWAGALAKERRHPDSFYIVKSDRALPYISEQYRSTSFVNRIRTFIINVPLGFTNGRKIEVAPWPSHVDEDGVMHFRANDSPESKRMAALGGVRVDIIVCATGYKQSFPSLETGYPTLDDAYVRGIYRDIEDDIAYIGFVRPSLGAIPPLAELQAQRWVHDMVLRFGGTPVNNRTKYSIKPYELDYTLRHRGEPHHAQRRLAVDHEAYAYQLALDIGAAPTWHHVLRAHGLKVFYTWAMGSNFNVKFRLVGPWSSPKVAAEAASIIRGELYNIVSQTGGLVFFFTYTLIPLFFFGPLSIAINTISWLWSWVCAPSTAEITPQTGER